MKDIITYINENNYNKNDCIVCCANDAVQDTLNKDKDFMHYRLNRKDGQEIFVVPIKNEKVRKILKWGSILVYKIPDKYNNVGELVIDYRDGKLEPLDLEKLKTF